MRIREVEDFGAVSRQRRHDLGLSQEKLAQRAGVTRQWLVRFEHGNPDVSLSKMFAVFDELGLSVRADPTGSRGSEGSAPNVKFTIPKLDMPHLNMDNLRRSLDPAREIPTERMLSEVHDAIRRLDAAQPTAVDTHND